MDCLLASPSVMWALPMAALGGMLLGAVLVACIWIYLPKKPPWLLPSNELEFSTTPICLGVGTYGDVIQATFRGMEVAVKRALPPEFKQPARRTNSIACRERQVHCELSIDCAATHELPTPRRTMPTIVLDTFPSGSVSPGSPRNTFNSALYDIFGRSNAVVSQLHRPWFQKESQEISRRHSRKQLVTPSRIDPTPEPVITAAHRRKALRAFRREMSALYLIRHPNVLTALGAVISGDGPPLIVMELMGRGSLYDLLHNPSYLFEGTTMLQILQNVANGVDFLHFSQVIHNDLKSQNVLLDHNFTAKVADFGLAFIGPPKPIGTIGTPYWMAPEVLRHEPATRASDVYSFGIVLFEALSREEPYDGLNPEEVIAGVADVKRGPGQWLRPTIPDSIANIESEVVHIMEECWHAEPQRRPTFTEIRHRLQRVDVTDLEKCAIVSSCRRSTHYTAASGSVDKRLSCPYAQSYMTDGDVVEEMPAATLSYTHTEVHSIHTSVTLMHKDSRRSLSSLRRRTFGETTFGSPRRFSSAFQFGPLREPENFDPVTCVFTDIVGFSTLSTVITSAQAVDLLNRLYTCFDDLVRQFGLFCVDIIGDAYMAVSGLNGESLSEQVAAVCQWAVQAVKAATQTMVCSDRPDLGHLQIRAGIHSGPCTAGVVGRQRTQFSLFGDTINVASRMESLSSPSCIQLSEITANAVMTCSGWPWNGEFLQSRGPIAVKGKGIMATYWLRFPGAPDPLH